MPQRSDLYESVVKQVAITSSNPFTVDAQDLISRYWWNAGGNYAEDRMHRLLVDTKSIAKYGTLRVKTHLVHGSLAKYAHSIAESRSKKNQFFEDLDEIAKGKDYWTYELLDACGSLFKENENLRNSLANFMWQLWSSEPDLADKITEACSANAILPSEGKFLYIGAAVLGPGELRIVAEEGNVIELIEFLLPCLQMDCRILSSFESLLSQASGKVLDHLWSHNGVSSNSRFQELLISNGNIPSSEIVNLIWCRWAEDENNLLEAALSLWSLPFVLTVPGCGSGPDFDELKRLDENQLFVESRAIIGSVDGLISGNVVTEVTILAVLFNTKKTSVIPRIFALVHRIELSAAREEICHRIISGAADKIELTRICREYKIAPNDEIQRSIFFLLTEQSEELLLSDPDLEALGIGYLSAEEDLRSRIRSALLLQPSLNLGQVLASFNSRDRLSRMSNDELDYFVEQLINRKEFEGLLEIGVNMSLALFLYICTKITKLDPSWRPRNADLSLLYGEFKSTQISQILVSAPLLVSQSNVLTFLNTGGLNFDENLLSQRKYGVVGRWPVGSVRTRIGFHGRINDLSFSPDGLFLAVAGSNNVVGEVDLSLGRLVYLERRFNSSVGSLSHIGNHRIVAGERTNNVTRTCRVVCIDNGEYISNVAIATGSITSLVNLGNDSLMFTSRDGTVGILELCDEVSVQASSRLGSEFPRLASEKSGARGNVVFTDAAIYASQEANKLKFGRPLPLPNRVKRASWISDNRIVYLDFAGRISFLEVDHDRRTLGQASGGSMDYSAVDLVPISNRNQVAVISSYYLTLMDSTNLATIGSLPVGGTSVHCSPNGDLVAVGDENGQIRLIDISLSAVPALFGKPIVSCTPSDFQMCTRAEQSILGQHQFDKVVSGDQEKKMKEILNLLLLLLRFKFRFDISMVEPSHIKGGDYDIQLG